MRAYLDLLQLILDEGVEQQDRTGVGTRSVFGHQLRFDLAKGFPLLTTKKLHLRSILVELLWFLRGDTNVRWLQENKVSIWDEWADEAGELGPVYGKQWRALAGAGRARDRPDRRADRTDQARSRARAARSSPPGTRPRSHLMALAPCHLPVPDLCRRAAGSTLQLYQRSADVFLGVPFNIASYALLTHMLAQQCGLEPGDLRLDRRRLPSLFEPSRPGPRAAGPRPAAAADTDPAPASQRDRRLCATRISRSAATTHIRTSRRRSRFDSPACPRRVIPWQETAVRQGVRTAVGGQNAEPDLHRRGQSGRRHRPPQRPALAPAHRHEILPRADARQCRDHGPQDVRSSFGRGALPRRYNIIISSHFALFPEDSDCRTATSVEDSLFRATLAPRIYKDSFVIGGATIYEQFAPFVDRYLITLVEKEVPDGDTFFNQEPLGDPDAWEIRPCSSCRPAKGRGGIHDLRGACPQSRAVQGTTGAGDRTGKDRRLGGTAPPGRVHAVRKSAR